jgi:hypothetical protein
VSNRSATLTLAIDLEAKPLPPGAWDLIVCVGMPRCLARAGL